MSKTTKANKLLKEVKNPSSTLGVSLKNATFWNVKNTPEGLEIELNVYGAPVLHLKQSDEGFLADTKEVEILLKELSKRLGKNS